MKILDRISQHSFLPGIVRPDSVVLDLGGNRGEFSLGIRGRYGWRSIAVEPTPALAAHLRDSGIEVVEAAVASEDGEAVFTYDPGHELTGSLMGVDVVGSIMSDENARRTSTVRTISLASLLARCGGAVDLVKVDIEGAELEMFLLTSDETLMSVRQFTVEFHDYWYPSLSADTERAKKRLQGLGFWMMRAGPNNKDVLFVHPDFRPKPLQSIYVGFWLRNLNGLWRMGRVLIARLRG